ncbi:dimeric dihydrodiol dehydrogenase [Piedraia hortae CBS 480.64]|uniref:D-xylose 1-dehydrogenase (NADP(+), D-xylono-1,5-lactone-forming) n=1 Tax=Piedraia hortae CBS 480.64 TaxID=1314780 RepID=A0A6A7C9Z3_9PEZI|nr:dimeric dihydrodiol dehydrogenase [Piedraia hortae CBS 480.64]
MSSPYELKWGFLACGGIAETFAKDLLIPPSTRDVTTIKHTIVGAATSNSLSRAASFLKNINAPEEAQPYATYHDLVTSPSPTIIYISSPHSHHYQHIRLCLEAGKHVLCEKAFTANAAQCSALIALAREKGLFLMEAQWTRYFPLTEWLRKAALPRIGRISRVNADLSIGKMDFDATHRMLNPDLAGGGLLDLGVYSLSWVFLGLYKGARPAVAGSAVEKHPTTGVDVMTSILLDFGEGRHAFATCGMRTSSDPDGKGSAGPCVTFQGERGDVLLFSPTSRPTRARVVLTDGTVEEKEFRPPGPGEGSGWYNGFGGEVNPEGEGHGMFYEADECAFAIRDGRLEGRGMGLAETLDLLRVCDEVREKHGVRFPERVETLEYPLKE